MYIYIYINKHTHTHVPIAAGPREKLHILENIFHAYTFESALRACLHESILLLSRVDMRAYVNLYLCAECL